MTTIGGPNAVKRFCSNTLLLRKFHLTDVQNTRDQITRGRRSKRDQIAFYAFHSFLLEVQTNAGYIYVTYA